jgi:ribose transport system permease protein
MQIGTRMARVKAILRNVPTSAWILLLMIIFFARATPMFLTLSNVANILSQGAILIILCMGVIVVKITGGIELSVSGVLTLAGMVMAGSIVKLGVPMQASLLLALLIGIIFGLLNGVFVTSLGLPSFIATLGTQGMAFGIALGMNEGSVYTGLPPSINQLGNGTLWGVPVAIWVSVAAVSLTWFLLNHTRFGVYVYALGGNEEALALAGKPAWWYKMLAYIYSGMMAGLAGIVMTARNMVSQPRVGEGMEFEAFAGVVLGGSFAAGRGSALGTIVGALFILVLRNGLNVVGVPTYIQLAIIGSVLITAIVLSTLVERRWRN